MFGVLRVDWNQVLFLPNQVQCYMGTWIVRLRLEKAIGDLTDSIGEDKFGWDVGLHRTWSGE